MDVEITMGAVQGILGSAVWLMGNYLYLRYRREARGGFKRFAAFWLGWPLTMGTLFFVPEGSARRGRAPELSVDEEEQALLEEIRRASSRAVEEEGIGSSGDAD